MAGLQSNVERLEAAGVVVKPLPEAYAAVLNELSGDEVDVIVSLKQRLDKAGESEGFAPAFTFFNLIVI